MRDIKIEGLLMSVAGFANDIKSKGRQVMFYPLNYKKG